MGFRIKCDGPRPFCSQPRILWPVIMLWEREGSEGVKVKVTEVGEDLTLGVGTHTIDHVLQNCTLEACMIL